VAVAPATATSYLATYAVAQSTAPCDPCAADCCPDSLPLRVQSARVTDGARGGKIALDGVSFRLRPGARLDPRAQDSTLTLADANGALLCATVPGARWKKTGRQRFTLREPRGARGSILTGTLSTTRNGGVHLDLHGARMPIGRPTGTALDVTLRAGGHCWRGAARSRRR
jgi:hypothetical protein